MGEDFIKKTERSYRRSLQRTVAERLFTPPLLRTGERTSTTYPCRLLQQGHRLTTDRLVLHRNEDRTIDVLDEQRVIGNIDGEPCQDLNEYLDNQPGAANIIQIKPLRIDGSFLDFTIDEEHGN